MLASCLPHFYLNRIGGMVAFRICDINTAFPKPDAVILLENVTADINKDLDRIDAFVLHVPEYEEPSEDCFRHFCKQTNSTGARKDLHTVSEC